MMSIICEAFGCTPGEAMAQDWATVKAVLDYRLMAQAKELHNTDPTKMSAGQMELWKEMVEAATEMSDG